MGRGKVPRPSGNTQVMFSRGHSAVWGHRGGGCSGTKVSDGLVGHGDGGGGER